MALNRKIWMWKIDLNFVYSIKELFFSSSAHKLWIWNNQVEYFKAFGTWCIVELATIEMTHRFDFHIFPFSLHSREEQEQHHQNTVFFEWLVNGVEKKNQLSNKVCTTISIEIQFIHLKGKKRENSRFMCMYDWINTDSTFFFHIYFLLLFLVCVNSKRFSDTVMVWCVWYLFKMLWKC